MSTKDKKKLSCHNCRKIKRKCDGTNPCSNCVKRNAVCEYANTDLRSQRFSVGYIKSLETNNEVFQNTLSLLVSLRNDPEKLHAKLESLATSVPDISSQTMGIYGYSKEFGENLDPNDEVIDATPIVDDDASFFGPGSIYHFGNFVKADSKPFFETEAHPPSQVVTLEQDFDYVYGLVEHFFEQHAHSLFASIFDIPLILKELRLRNFSGQFLSQELVYSICANSSKLTYRVADAYYDFSARMMFTNNIDPTLAKSQAYFLLSHHQFSKGQMLNGWLLSGLALRAGYDVGFDYPSSVSNAPNRLYVAGVINDFWLGLMIGRRTTMRLYDIPILRLPEESETDYLVFKSSVELVEMSREMILATYKPIAFDKDPRVNYLMKFNRVKTYNMKLMQWQSRLDPKCHWLHASLKASKTILTDNHMLKFLYYHILLCINKPFVRILRKHSTMYVMEEMAQDVYIIISAKYKQLQNENGGVAELPNGELRIMRPYRDTDQYNPLSIEVCMVTLMCHVLMFLMSSLPKHYLYLEEHFLVFCKFLSLKSPRKYKYENNPISLLYNRYVELKAGLHTSGSESLSAQQSNSPQTLVGSHKQNIERPYETIPNEAKNIPQVEFDLSQYRPEIPEPAVATKVPLENTNKGGYQLHNEFSMTYPADMIPKMQQMGLSDTQTPFQADPSHMPLVAKSSQSPQQVDESHFTDQLANAEKIQGYDSYDWSMNSSGSDPWPITNESLNKMVNSMFADSGHEFTVDKDWDMMFTDEYLDMM